MRKSRQVHVCVPRRELILGARKHRPVPEFPGWGGGGGKLRLLGWVLRRQRAVTGPRLSLGHNSARSELGESSIYILLSLMTTSGQLPSHPLRPHLTLSCHAPSGCTEPVGDLRAADDKSDNVPLNPILSPPQQSQSPQWLPTPQHLPEPPDPSVHIRSTHPPSNSFSLRALSSIPLGSQTQMLGTALSFPLASVMVMPARLSLRWEPLGSV